MGIRVNPSKAVTAAVSYVEPGFSVTWQEVEAAASWVDAQAIFSYLEVGVTAEVTFPDVYQVDVVTPTDLVALTTSKVLTDTTSGFVDSINTAFTKGLADSISMIDAVDIEYWIEKYLADVTTPVDSASRAFSKSIDGDTATGTDSAAFSVSKALSDILSTPVDTISFGTTKALSDNSAAIDDFQRVVSYVRAYADSMTGTDSPPTFATTLGKSETIGSTESTNYSLTKPLSEAMILLDNMDGDIEYQFVKTTTEVLVLSSEQQAIDFTRQSSDNVLTSSSGVLAMQDYSDITYFLEDYVGITRAFT